MPDVPNNPFVTGRMIRAENKFVGRSREIGNILARIRNRDSVSVVGERRIGKSSLLYHLFLTGNTRLGDRSRQKYRFLFLDGLSSLLDSPVDLITALFKELEIAVDATELQQAPLKVMTRELQAFSASGSVPVLFIDEFESLTTKPECFNDAFFENLRFCCNQGLVTVVTASQHSLRELTDKAGLTSPFWNIFTNMFLQEFVVDEQLNEFEEFICLYWLNKLAPTWQELGFLVAYENKHPLVLQVVSFHLFQNRFLKQDAKALPAIIKTELTSYFRSDKEKIQRWLKQKSKVAVAGFDSITEYLGRQVKHLGQLLEFLNK